MSTDQRLNRYFNARATTVELRPGDPSQIAARAGARRRRRRSVLTGVTALAVVAAALGVQQVGGGDDDRGQLAAQPGLAPATSLDWTVVEPKVGLAWSHSTAVTADGTVYSLSTAPGRHDPNKPLDRRVLYRSSNGVEWQTVTVPDDLFPAKLAANGDQLYAVGTAPAGGGGRALVLGRAGSDGAWEQVDLPLDLVELERAYGRVNVSELTVAASDTGAVAAVTLATWPNPADFLPAGADINGDWRWTADGIELYEPECSTGELAERRAREGTVELPERDALAGTDPTADGSPGLAQCRTPLNDREPSASYSWDELGVDERLRSLIHGEVHVFTSVDGTTFTEVDLPVGGRTSATVIATDTGYVLVTSHWQQRSSDVLRSADGRTWEVDPAASFDGYVLAAGTLGGRAAVVTTSDLGSLVLRTDLGGGWSSTDLTAAIDAPAGAVAWGGEARFGPLGLAATVTIADPNASGSGEGHVVVVDEHGVSTVAIGAVAGLEASPMSVHVSADAVTVGLIDPTRRPDPDTLPTMKLLVGTPTG